MFPAFERRFTLGFLGTEWSFERRLMARFSTFCLRTVRGDSERRVDYAARLGVPLRI
jgi:hypothetical protein